MSQLKSLYRFKFDVLRKNPENDIRNALAVCSINIKKLKYIEVSSFVAKNVAYTNYFDVESGVIVCSENFKDRDENAPCQRVWPSDILWQSWIMVVEAQGVEPSSLQAIIRFCVTNELTKRVIWDADIFSTYTVDGPEHQREYTQRDPAYHAILNSVNGASTMRMLRDHEAQLGYRTVERVIVLGKLGLMLEEPESRSFVIVLTPPRIPSIMTTQAGSVE